MKQGQTFHHITCDCSFCKSGETKFPIPCQATFKEHCQYPKCDCDRPADINDSYVTDPRHGGKVTCHKCNGFIQEKDSVPYLDYQHPKDFPKAHFHKDCYNGYEHYYGLDRPID